jgi:hypothetical protein
MSQSQAPCDVTVVVACLSTMEKWDQFRGTWAAALKPFGTTVLHTTEYVGGITTGTGPYGLLKKDTRRRKMFERRLTRIVHDHVLANVLEAVPEQDHRALIPHLRDRKPVHSDSYYFCLQGCLLRIQLACVEKHIPNTRVVAFAENSTDPRRDNRIKERYDRLRESPLLANFGPMTVGKKDDPEMFGCQAADWIAFGAMNLASRMFMGRTLGKAQTRLAERVRKSGKLHGIMFMQKPGLYRRFVLTSMREEDAVRRVERPPVQAGEPMTLMSDEECDAYLKSRAASSA